MLPEVSNYNLSIIFDTNFREVELKGAMSKSSPVGNNNSNITIGERPSINLRVVNEKIEVVTMDFAISLDSQDILVDSNKLLISDDFEALLRNLVKVTAKNQRSFDN